MIEYESLHVAGHLSAATCEHLEQILQIHGIKTKIKTTPLSTTEPFGLDETTISLAGAVASIVSCVVGMWQLRKQLEHVDRGEQEESIDDALRQIGDGTFERIGSIRVHDNVALKDAKEFSVTLRDVPAARFFVITVRNLREIIVIDSSELQDERRE